MINIVSSVVEYYVPLQSPKDYSKQEKEEILAKLCEGGQYVDRL